MRTAAPDAMKQYLGACVDPHQFERLYYTQRGACAYAESGVKTTGVVR